MTGINDWDDIYDITFKYTTGLHSSSICQTLFAFDIETSNGWRQSDGTVVGFDHDKYKNDEAYRNSIDYGEPVSCLYIWQIAIEDLDDIKVFVGRTWGELYEFMTKLTMEVRRQSVYGQASSDRAGEDMFALYLKKNVNMKIYVHNLGFEFQHLRNIFEDKFARTRKSKRSKVFARNPRKPMKAAINLSKVNVNFTDSLVLVQKSLSAWCKDEKLPVQKLQEPKDYYLEMRTPLTKLTDEELNYSINDVVSMIWGLKKYRDKYASIAKIPLTQTGEVRRKCREKVSRVNAQWAKQCHKITTEYTPEEFKRLVWLFQGGWTHANKMYVGDVLKDVKCFDFASSYPAVMTTRTFPLGQFEKCNVSDFTALESQDLNTADFRWYMKVELDNVVSKLDNSYWSLSKVALDEDNPVSGQVVDNGRIFACSHMVAYMTDLDWDTFKQCYYYDNVNVKELYKSSADYLPTEMIETILDYFQYKTSLKGIPDSESLYVESKQFINSIYGVFVTKIVSAIIDFTEKGWVSKDPTDHDFYEMISQTKEEDSFTMYQAGVWVTAWARHNLFDFIIPLDKRIAYCDTDSIKGLFTDDDIKFIEDYNKQIEDIENKVAAQLGIDPAKYTAQTSKGKTKRLGVMEREDDCEEFKTLGAKRYVDLVNGEVECTIAGLPKRAAKAKIKSVAEFTDGIIWDTKESEKLIARYEDNQQPCTWIDRDGNKYDSDAQFGICLQPTTFDLSIGNEFKHFLTMLKSGIIDREDEFYADTPSWFFK